MAVGHVIPPDARGALPGLTIQKVEEKYPHNLRIYFTDGSSMGVTGMPFTDGTLDVDFISADLGSVS